MAATADELFGIRYGSNVVNLTETTEEEIDSFLNHARRGRGPLDPGPSGWLVGGEFLAERGAVKKPAVVQRWNQALEFVGAD